MITKKAIITGAIALSTLAMGAGVLAQNVANPMNLSINQSGWVALTGTVSAVSGNTISVTSWLGTWTVNAANAQITPGNSTIGQITVGDKVKVSGTLGTGMTVNAAMIKNASLARKAFVGTISNLNATTGTFTLATNNAGNVTVATNSATQISVNGTTGTFADLQNGSMATVHGSFAANTNTVTADVVKIPALQLNGNHKGWFKSNITLNKLFKHFWKD